MLLNPTIDLILRCAFGALFAVALVHKIIRFANFRGTLTAYLRGSPLATEAASYCAAILFMLGEATAALLCLLPVTRLGRATAVVTMLLLYAGAMGINLLRGNTLLDCGCNWGERRQPVGYALVWRNLFLAFVGLALALPVSTRPLAAVDLITVLVSIPMAALIYASVNGLFANFAPTYGTR